ncbi:sucrose nonfermenting protein [Trifolium repens]|nr:sucrose nonfermenting protein [Trifolium repens]
MYASVTDRGYEGSVGGSGAILIPSCFVWRHGGRRVFLTGSFTRWSEHIPMSLMEGCPSVFQVFCSLMPGYQQVVCSAFMNLAKMGQNNLIGSMISFFSTPFTNVVYG